MQIGELAKKLGIKTDTLRFYEKNKLLTASQRSASGYRRYSMADYHQAQFILRCKSVGFSLTEIKELLAIQVDKSNHSCQEVKQQIIDKRQDIERRLLELGRFHASLVELETACCGGDESAESCSILEALTPHD